MDTPLVTSDKGGTKAFVGLIITATKTDAFPSHSSGKANPGDTITYTVTISNTGGSGTKSLGVQQSGTFRFLFIVEALPY